MRARLHKEFQDKVVLNDLSLQVKEGEVVCVLGESGVGKTTLLRCLAGLIPYDGEVEKEGDVAFVFQEHRLLPHLTVAENLRYVGGSEEKIKNALFLLEIDGLKDKKAGLLSGGESQRVGLARAFCVSSKLWLLDEPFTSLDTPLKIRLWNAFARIWSVEKPATVLVTHDLEEAWALGHRILLLDGGKIVKEWQPKRKSYPTPYGEDSEEKRGFLQDIL